MDPMAYRVAERYLAARAGLSAIDFERIAAEEGLRHLGGRYGKAGEFWGLEGHSRVISVGRRDILLNVFLISIGRDDQMNRPDTRWVLHRSEYQSRLNEDTFRQWCAWVKRGYTTADLRRLAREKYMAGTPHGVVVLTGAMKREGAA